MMMKENTMPYNHRVSLINLIRYRVNKRIFLFQTTNLQQSLMIRRVALLRRMLPAMWMMLRIIAMLNRISKVWWKTMLYPNLDIAIIVLTTLINYSIVRVYRLVASSFPFSADIGDLADHIPTPPDGGYGWIIVLSAFLSNFVVDGVANSFAVFLPEYQRYFGSTAGTTAVIGSLLIGTYLLSGPLAGGLVNKYSARSVVIAGACISSIAMFVSVYVSNVYAFMAVFGFIGGKLYPLSIHLQTTFRHRIWSHLSTIDRCCRLLFRAKASIGNGAGSRRLGCWHICYAACMRLSDTEYVSKSSPTNHIDRFWLARCSMDIIRSRTQLCHIRRNVSSTPTET